LQDQLSTAIANADANAVCEAAHALKSSSSNIGAAALAELCNDLETLGREHNLERAPGLVEQLVLEYQRVIDALHLETQKAVI
jgi:HPt (histidine-containing phosphotransfer) domain-containing protein